MNMLEKAKRIIAENGYNVYAVAEIKDGKETYETLQPSNPLNNIYSVSKTVTATAAGLLENKGLLFPESPIFPCLKSYLPDNYDKQLEKAELRHLLTHSLGHENGYMFEQDRRAFGTDDWVSYVLSQPLKLRLGEKLVYTNSVYYILSLIIENITGVTLLNFLRQELFVPLKFYGYASGSCPAGHTLGASEMFISCLDMARLGSIYLNGGIYRGKRYLSEKWIKDASSPIYADGSRFYGYSFWRNSATTPIYYGDGAHGQILLINPKQNSVFTMQSYDDRLNTADFTRRITE